MDVYPYEASSDGKPEFSEDESQEDIRRVIAALPNGEVSKVTIRGNEYSIDKTGRDTKVTPIYETNSIKEAEQQAEDS